VNGYYYFTYPVAAVIGCALTFGVALFAVALARALVVAPDLIAPAADQAEQAKARPVGPGEFAPDLCWPLYPFRQSRADVARAERNMALNNAAAWRAPVRSFFGDAMPFWWVVFPVPILIIVFLALASLASWCCYLVYALVTTVSAGVSRAVLGATAALLCAAERARRSRVRTDAACMRCFHVTPWPAYRCPACRRLHHDVRPGRLGVLFRRCACGTRLPTMASRAAWRVTPVCKRCKEELAPGAGAVRDIRVPVFGDISAGKSRFLYASLSSLIASAARAGLDVSFPDQHSQEQAEFGLGVIRSRRETAKTSPNGQVSLTVRLGRGRPSELVHLFDAAGEHFRRARRPDALRFLDDGQGLVYVLDPFSIESVRKGLGGANAPEVVAAHAAAGDPELTYDEVASRLRDTGVPASRGRLAVVVSKADLLRRAGLSLPDGSDEIAQWLWDHDVHNLVMSARRDFAEARFYAVASQEMPPGAPHDPGAPLRWLLTTHGVRLPADSDGPPGQPGASRPAGWRAPHRSGSGPGAGDAGRSHGRHAGASS
jgi:Double-GTPase 2